MRAQAAFPFLFCAEVKTMARHRGTDVRYVLKVEWLLGDPDSERCYNGIMLSVPQEPLHKQEVSTQDDLSCPGIKN